MSANTLEADTGNNCLYPKVLYIPEGIITVRDSDLCPVMIQMGSMSYVSDPNGVLISVNYML